MKEKYIDNAVVNLKFNPFTIKIYTGIRPMAQIKYSRYIVIYPIH